MTDVDRARELLANWIQTWTEPETDRLEGQLLAQNLLPATHTLDNARWGYLAAITGLDSGDAFEALYHFCAGPTVLTLRVRIPHSAPSVPSICNVIPYASPFERELSEMLGIEVLGTPNPDRLLLPDDWPEGVYPLRKEVDGDEKEES